jgi:hypothetical protein
MGGTFLPYTASLAPLVGHVFKMQEVVFVYSRMISDFLIPDTPQSISDEAVWQLEKLGVLIVKIEVD